MTTLTALILAFPCGTKTTIDISEPQCIISHKSPQTFPAHLTLWMRERALP
jgi:hypothetical protein